MTTNNVICTSPYSTVIARVQALLQKAHLMHSTVAVLSLGGLYSIFMAMLAHAGHEPTGKAGLPVAADQYYAVASYYLTPLFVVLWFLFSLVAHRIARPRCDLKRTLTLLGFTYAVPLTVLYLIPDIVLFVTSGHGALVLGIRYFAPLAIVVLITSSIWVLHTMEGVPYRRAALAVFLALVAQGIPGALLIR